MCTVSLCRDTNRDDFWNSFLRDASRDDCRSLYHRDTSRDNYRNPYCRDTSRDKRRISLNFWVYWSLFLIDVWSMSSGTGNVW